MAVVSSDSCPSSVASFDQFAGVLLEVSPGRKVLAHGMGRNREAGNVGAACQFGNQGLHRTHGEGGAPVFWGKGLCRPDAESSYR